MSHPDLQLVIYNCSLCHPKKSIFNSRKALQAHLCWTHQSGIDRRRSLSGSCEDIVVKLSEHQLIAKRRKFQMRTASPAERRALQQIERKRIIDILPCYVPSLFDQISNSDDELRSVESSLEASNSADRTASQLTDNLNMNLVGKERKMKESEDEEASGSGSLVNTEIKEYHQEVNQAGSLQTDNNIADILLNPTFLVNQETDWFAETEIESLLPELGNTVGINYNTTELYRADTPVTDVLINEAEETAAEVNEYCCEEIPPPLMFADNQEEDDITDRQIRREDDITDRQTSINTIMARSCIDNSVRTEVHSSGTNVNFVIPLFDDQCSALMNQISAETFVFPDTPIETLADRIALNSATLSNSEIGRLTRMSAIAQKNFAKAIISRLTRASVVAQDANLLLTSLVSEVLAVADRQV